jgi:hypothetical protein
MSDMTQNYAEENGYEPDLDRLKTLPAEAQGRGGQCYTSLGGYLSSLTLKGVCA